MKRILCVTGVVLGVVVGAGLVTGLGRVQADAAPAKDAAKARVSTMLMFQDGRAEEAMNRYVELFGDAGAIQKVEHYGPGAPSPEGKVMVGEFTLNGHRVMCTDSPAVHAFDFTPSVSLFVDCASNEDLERLFAALSKDGQVMMPLNNYGFSKRFGFVQDEFGVSWQLNLPNE